MAVVTIPSTVTTDATPIVPPEAYAIPGTVCTVVSNTGPADVFIGPHNVTTTTGVRVAAGANQNLPTLNSPLFAVTAAGESTVVVGLFS